MQYTYAFATADDLDALVAMRIRVLRAANQLPESICMADVAKQAEAYYRNSLRDGAHVACLVYDGKTIIGAGGVSFFQVLPTFHNPSGQKAYIMNMYVDPAYRRRGIGRQVLDLLVCASKDRGIANISLEATEMGRHLYQRYGFVQASNEMYLP